MVRALPEAEQILGMLSYVLPSRGNSRLVRSNRIVLIFSRTNEQSFCELSGTSAMPDSTDT
jgi:hypothetical protein